MRGIHIFVRGFATRPWTGAMVAISTSVQLAVRYSRQRILHYVLTAASANARLEYSWTNIWSAHRQLQLEVLVVATSFPQHSQLDQPFSLDRCPFHMIASSFLSQLQPIWPEWKPELEFEPEIHVELSASIFALGKVAFGFSDWFRCRVFPAFLLG